MRIKDSYKIDDDMWNKFREEYYKTYWHYPTDRATMELFLGWTGMGELLPLWRLTDILLEKRPSNS